MDRWWLVVIREDAVPGHRLAHYCGLTPPEDGIDGPMIPEFSLGWDDEMLLFDHRSAVLFKEDLEQMFSNETWGVVNFADLASDLPGVSRTIRPGSVEALSWPYVHKFGATFPCADDGEELC